MKQSLNTLFDRLRFQQHPVLLLTGCLLLGISGCASTTETDIPKANSIITSTSSDTSTLAAKTETTSVETVSATTETVPSATTEVVAQPADAEAEPVTAPLSQNDLNKQLWDAAQTGDAATVSTLLEQGADANTATASGETALHAAIAAGSFPAVMQLVSKGANVNAATATGWTPLHHAARFGRADAANYLLQQGADPKAVTNSAPAKTPVQMALDQGDLRTARILGY